MWHILKTVAWLICIVYSTIPCYWFLVHPQADYWRARSRSPFRLLLPAWMLMWLILALATAPWRHSVLYQTGWTWIPAIALFALGICLYTRSGKNFSAKQLGGIPEVRGGQREQRLVTSGIREHVRHPVYLAHLCELLAWSLGTGLRVCYGLTVFAIITGTVMIRMEDRELEQRFGEQYVAYKSRVPAVWPRLRRS